MERPAGQVPVERHGGRLFVEAVDHRVDLGVHRLDPGPGRFDQIRGRGLTVPDEIGLGGGVESGECVGHVLTLAIPRLTGTGPGSGGNRG